MVSDKDFSNGSYEGFQVLVFKTLSKRPRSKKNTRGRMDITIVKERITRATAREDKGKVRLARRGAHQTMLSQRPRPTKAERSKTKEDGDPVRGELSFYLLKGGKHYHDCY